MPARITPSKGHKPDKLIKDALMVAIKREAVDSQGKPTIKLALMCEAMVDEAIKGNVHAFTAIRDSIDGRPAQKMEVDADGKEFTITWKIGSDQPETIALPAPELMN